MKTKIFTLLLAVAASIGTMNAAIVNGTCGDNLTWSLNTKDSTLNIIGSGEMTSAPWNEYKQYIAHVSLPDNLTSICDNAYNGCSAMTKIVIPNTISKIGESAFSGSGLTGVYISDLAAWCNINFAGGWWNNGNPVSIAHRLYLNDTEVVDLVIPSGIKTIKENSFRECWSLESIVIPNSVTSIGRYAFYGCYNLTGELVIPNSIKSFDFCDAVFSACKFTSVVIGENLQNIFFNVFEDCDQIKTVTWNAKNCESYNFGAQVETYIFGDSVQIIPASLCSGMKKLTSITIPSNVASIGNAAFSGCTNLSSLTILRATPPSGGASSGINAATCTLFVPENTVDTYANTIWWEDFLRIRAIGSSMLVQFIDWNGTILSEQMIDEGESATAPADPTRAGYTFIGWDKDFSNITEDLVVTAQYKINRYEVIFKDWDGTILKSDSVDYNTAATAPANPSREGHEFIGWDKDFSHVSSDMIINARYAVNYYPVGFLNYDGTLLSEQSIAYNQAAMEPNVPTREGYTFIGWTADIEHITARTFAIALYEKNGINVTYISEEGDTIVSEKVDMHLPDAPIVSGKTFTSWLTESASNAEGIVFRATYTLDNPTTGEDVVVIPTSSTAGVSFPYITGAMTYMLVIRDLFGTVVCKIMFDADGHLLGIAFAPGRNRTQKAQSEGFHFTVEGLTPSTTYEYEFVAYDEADQVIGTLTGSFETTADETGVNNISSASAPQKVINDGHVFVLRGDKTYTMQGQEVK